MKVSLQHNKLGTDQLHFRVAIQMASYSGYIYLSVEEAQDLMIQLMRELHLAEEAGYEMKKNDGQSEIKFRNGSILEFRSTDVFDEE
jgi:hypothetical protein